MSEQVHGAIEFHDVTMAYEDRVILDEVSFIVNPGETKIVMGGSGTGKSTILKLVLGLIKPQSGRILIDGDDVTRMTEAELTEPQENRNGLSGRRAVRFPLGVRERRVSPVRAGLCRRKKSKTRVRDARFVNLEQTMDMMPSELSVNAAPGRHRLALFDFFSGTPCSNRRNPTFSYTERESNSAPS